MTEPTYAVFDTETTMNCPIGNNAATPFHPSNKMVLWGYKRGDYNAVHSFVPDPSSTTKFGSFGGSDIKMLVGHNIGFDIHHMRVAKKIDEEFLGTVGLWDTQLVEYLLSGQTHTYPALDDLSAKYGGTAKDASVTAIFDSGKGADHVPMEKLKPYHAADLLNTELVFVKQFTEAEKRGMVPLITTQMDALAATIEMTYNGLAVDKRKLEAGCLHYASVVAGLESDIKGMAMAFGYPDFNVGSGKQLSTLLFGGEIETITKESAGFFKNGKAKYKNVTIVEKVTGPCYPVPLDVPRNANGYSTDDAVLNGLLGKYHGSTNDFIKCVIDYREKKAA